MELTARETRESARKILLMNSLPVESQSNIGLLATCLVLPLEELGVEDKVTASRWVWRNMILKCSGRQRQPFVNGENWSFLSEARFRK